MEEERDTISIRFPTQISQILFSESNAPQNNNSDE